MPMNIQIRLLVRSDVLSGALPGRRLFLRLVEEVSGRHESEKICFLDFLDIKVVTSSFLRESVIAFRNYVSSHVADLSVVLANLNDDVREELNFFLTQTSDALWVCSRINGTMTRTEVLGSIDDVQRMTLDLVIAAGKTSAPALAAVQKDLIGVTGWNNRLASLAARGLVVQHRQGKTKMYSPVLEEPNGT